MLHQMGNLRMAEPKNAGTKIALPTVIFLLAKKLPKAQVGQRNPELVPLFSLLRFSRSTRFIFVSGMNRSTPLSKASITVPKGQIQLQNAVPKRNIRRRKSEVPTKRKKTRRAMSIPETGDIPHVSRVCKPPRGQASHVPGSVLIQETNFKLHGEVP
jgi:hypothetical protein